MPITLGNYLIHDWSGAVYYRMREDVPVQYFYQRIIDLIIEPVVEIENPLNPFPATSFREPISIDLKNPWGCDGVIYPNEWILGFRGGIYATEWHSIYEKMYPDIRWFDNIVVALNQVDKFLAKLQKLKCFV